jgi:hypothetical protein
MSATERIGQRIVALHREADELRLKLAVLEHTVAELESLRDELAADGDSQPHGRRQLAEPASQSTDKQKPVPAVKTYVGRFPQGVLLKQLVEDLANDIATTSDDPRRLLYNTVYNLRKRGALVGFQDDQGREGVKLASVANTDGE